MAPSSPLAHQSPTLHPNSNGQSLFPTDIIGTLTLCLAALCLIASGWWVRRAAVVGHAQATEEIVNITHSTISQAIDNVTSVFEPLPSSHLPTGFHAARRPGSISAGYSSSSGRLLASISLYAFASYESHPSPYGAAVGGTSGHFTHFLREIWSGALARSLAVVNFITGAAGEGAHHEVTHGRDAEEPSTLWNVEPTLLTS